jgi:hypothetical protein
MLEESDKLLPEITDDTISSLSFYFDLFFSDDETLYDGSIKNTLYMYSIELTNEKFEEVSPIIKSFVKNIKNLL